MRPVRITGITGTGGPVPLDVYARSTQTTVDLTGAGTLQVTANNVFDPTITPTWHPAPAKDTTTGLYFIPAGIRAVQATGMVAADVLSVSQQGY